jgi:rhodanese-related sulfurtransferase
MSNRVVYALVAIALIVVVVTGVVVLTGGSNAPESGAAVAAVDANSAAVTLPAMLSPQDYQASYADSDHLLLDVRTPEEFAEEHIAGAVNISLQTLPQRLSEIPGDKPVIVYCRSGNRSAEAVNLLRQAGYTAVTDMGGIIAWKNAGLPVEN